MPAAVPALPEGTAGLQHQEDANLLIIRLLCSKSAHYQLSFPIHSSCLSPAPTFTFVDFFSVLECEYVFSWAISGLPVFLVWGRVLDGLSRLSSFFMGVANSSSFCFLRAVNSSKNMRRRLIFDSPSMVFPWKDSRFLRTRRVLEAGSKPSYSG